ncbi:DUF5916 domain-containing protein [Flavobacterium dankookense]|uniref:Carbohydrate binding protein with CBM9 domain n=1 Tax=Flavobacterium dankookense TaxID=706186 RepID=A0A4R6Q7J5_9FLAO|nr:DUF5916 domain-containing protein [Flavobacterium dankookense]TDP58201.1 carbohydrate binding protein with CBM9 domain [Flavobacterium dankookense]
MPKVFHYYFAIILFSSVSLFAQKRSLKTQLISEKITIDGNFDEKSWENAEIATNFIEIFPTNGKPESNNRRSEVKIIYDNEAIYVAAKLFDNEPNKILKELTLRDNFATADHFGVWFNGYNDGQQEFRFFVSAAGVQIDAVYTEASDEDYTWDAIWDSKTKVTDFGWVVEMKIPYAALRFSTVEKQTWGFNIYREVRRERQKLSWSLLDNKIVNESVQAGILEGIENIKTPTRLFLIPYSSYYLNANTKQKAYGEFRGGLDVKYGINDAFTLDAILVPDFGQTKFDNVELNLSAFEQQFAENRPFFTEGTDLFNKGNLLYTRRIGGSPSTYPIIDSNEEVIDYPTTVDLLNAVKVSGRTKGGLGIGVLNAVTEKTDATIRKTTVNSDNTTTTENRKVVVEPLTNFNVLVLDQRFNQNSSVAFVNTNVTRNGEFRDANVSALVWDLNTKQNSYNLSGNFKYSYINELYNNEDKKGYDSYLEFRKTSGKYRFAFSSQYVSNDYDNNDLGINFQTHYHSIYGSVSYRILKPNNLFNAFSPNMNFYNEFDNRTGRLQANRLSLNFNIDNKKNDYFGFGINSKPLVTYDFYEPRSIDERKFVEIPEQIQFFLFFSENYNNKFAIDFNPSYTFINELRRVNYGFYFGPRYRVNDKISLVYGFNFFRQNNNTGWVAFDDFDNTIFARRDRKNFTNEIQAKYSINEKMNFNLLVRHYWSYVTNKQFLTLKEDGTFENNFVFNENLNQNFNTWNLDLSYSWWFAPGSQLSILYRNQSAQFSREFNRNFDNNFNSAINNENLNHTLSFSIRYFIDYNSLKK